MKCAEDGWQFAQKVLFHTAPRGNFAMQDLQVAIGIPHMAVKTSPRRLADMGERSSSQCFLSDLSNMKVFARSN
jgi:hypothetical protein